MRSLGAAVREQGWVLLAVDSFGPRGIAHRCTFDVGSYVDRLMDAYGALQFLARNPSVDADRVAVMGFSQGAMVALSAVRRGGVEELFERRFRAVVAYYPFCFEHDFSVPSLILIGELDDWTPAKACEAMRERKGASSRLVIYPGAYHAFNYPWPANTRNFGHRLEYNEVASKAAWDETVTELRNAFEK